MRVEDINLLDLDVYARGGIPHEWFAHLRAHDPVFWHDEPDGPGFWVITKHEDVRAIGRDPATFSSDQARGGVAPIEGPAADEAEVPFKPLLMMDPPEHTRYRKLVNRGFTPRIITALEPHLRDLAAEILDSAVAKGSCDFVVDVAAELPLQVIAEFLGVPREDRHRLFDWINRMTGSQDPEYAISPDSSTQAQIELFMYANELASTRREEPQADIVSELLQAEVDGDALTEMEFNAFFILLAAAGNETTRNAIAHGVAAFLDNPDQYERLVDDPAGTSASAAEEILRWASPVTYFRRNVLRDTELRGKHLRAGDKVSLWYPSANRDEEVFDQPFRFDVTRAPNDHLAFGGGGPHFCLGASLARAEIQILFEELAVRVPLLRAAGDVAYLRSNLISGIKHLPVEFVSTAVRS